MGTKGEGWAALRTLLGEVADGREEGGYDQEKTLAFVE